jgi:hypothetical protein
VPVSADTTAPDALFDLADLTTTAEPAPTYTVHCFFDCPTVVRDPDPNEAHRLMEEHYATVHRADIDNALAAFA